MNSLEIIPATSDQDLKSIADLASIIWHEHFSSILSMEQIDYMVHKFQSYPALKNQIDFGYEYYQINSDNELVGYLGIQPEEDNLFLSKLYVRKDCRGKGISSQAFAFLKDLCQERSIKKIWLTCNKYNHHTLEVYKHFGFTIVESKEADIGDGFIMDDYVMEYQIAPTA